MIRDVDALRDDQWAPLQEFVRGGRKGKRGPRADNRRFLNALLWMARSDGCWRGLPGHLGDSDTVKRRYYAGSRGAFSTPCLRLWRAKPIWNG